MNPISLIIEARPARPIEFVRAFAPLPELILSWVVAWQRGAHKKVTVADRWRGCIRMISPEEELRLTAISACALVIGRLQKLIVLLAAITQVLKSDHVYAE